MRVNCTKGGISVSTPQDSGPIEICLPNLCIRIPNPERHQEILIPSAITVLKYHPRIKIWRSGYLVFETVISCPEQILCETLTCIFCWGRLLNPQCTPKIFLVIFVVILYMIIVLLAPLLTCSVVITLLLRVFKKVILLIIKLTWRLILLLLLGCRNSVRCLFGRRDSTGQLITLQNIPYRGGKSSINQKIISTGLADLGKRSACI